MFFGEKIYFFEVGFKKKFQTSSHHQKFASSGLLCLPSHPLMFAQHEMCVYKFISRKTRCKFVTLNLLPVNRLPEWGQKGKGAGLVGAHLKSIQNVHFSPAEIQPRSSFPSHLLRVYFLSAGFFHRLDEVFVLHISGICLRANFILTHFKQQF